MTPRSIVAELLRRGVEVAVDSGEIRLRSPEGALIPELREAIVASKPAVMQIVGPGVHMLTPHSAVVRTLLLERRRPGDPTLLRQSQMGFEGALDEAALRCALDALIQRHEALRSYFIEIEGVQAMAIRAEADPVSIHLVSSPDALDSWLDADSRRSFDLGRAPLLRLAVSDESGYHRIVLTHHQAIADAWTTALLWKEISLLYAGFRAGARVCPEAMPMGYLEAVRSEKAFEAGTACRAMTDWWLAQLEGAPVEPWQQTIKDRTGGYRSATLAGATTQSIAALSHATRTTPFTVFLAALAALLHRATGQRDFSVGAPVANRSEPGIHPVAGYFSNLVVIRIDTSGEDSFRQLVETVRVSTLAALERQRVPFQTLVAGLAGDRADTQNPLFQIMFNMAEVQPGGNGGKDFAFLPVRGAWQTDVDLTLTVLQRDDRWEVGFYYNRGVLDEAQIGGFTEGLESILQSAALNPGRSLASIPIPQLAIPWKLHDAESQAIEARLLDQPGVRDAAVLKRPNAAGRERLVAYVSRRSSATPFPVISGVELVEVNCIPRDRRGLVIRERLLRIPVVTDDVVGRLERRFSKAAEPVAVLLARLPEPTPLLHELDLTPSWTPGDFGGSAGTVAPNHADPPSDRQDLPAMADGGPLNRPEGSPRTLIEALTAAAASSWPGQVRHIRAGGDDRIDSWADILLDGRRIAAACPRIRRGAPVAISLTSTYETLRAYWAALLAGGAPAILPLPSGSTDEAAALHRLRSCWGLLDKPIVFTSHDLAEQVQAAYSGAHGEPRIFSIDGATDKENPASISIEDLESSLADEDDIALFSFTSGSTGLPKCIPLTHRNLIARALGSISRCQMKPSDVTLNWLPFDHIGSMSDWHFRSVVLRCQSVYVETAHILQRPLRWLDCLSACKVTHSWAPNFAYGLVTRALREDTRREWDLHSVRSLLTAGENVSAATSSEFLRLLAPCGLVATAIHPAYGMAEMGSGVTYCPPEPGGGILVHYVNRRSLGARITQAAPGDPDAVALADSGEPIPGIALRIAGESGTVSAADTVGRLQIRGEAVFSGYYRNPEATRAAFTPDGWLETGDLGYLSNGRLVLAGRAKDVLIVNGANYACSEVEAAVESAAGVAQASAAVVSVPGSNGGDGAGVFFALSGAPGDLPAVVRDIRSAVLRRVGIDPEYLLRVEPNEIPRTSIGKIRRASLRDDLLRGKWNQALKEVDLALENARTFPDAFHEIHWQAVEPVASVTAPREIATVILRDRGSVAASFIAQAADACVLNPGEDWNGEVCRTRTEGCALNLVWFAVDWPCPGHGLVDLLALFRTLVARAPAASARLFVVSSQSQMCQGDEQVEPGKAALAALVRTAAGEIPAVSIRHVDIRDDDPRVPDYLLREINAAGNTPEVAWRNGVRRVRGLRRVAVSGRLAGNLIPGGAAWVLPGGLGGIGSVLSEWLIRRHGAKLILCGRTDLESENASARSKRAALAALQDFGTAVYLRGGVEDAGLESRIRDQLRAWCCPPGGMIDLTTSYRRVPVADVGEAEIAGAIAPRLASARLARALADSGAIAIGFSSIASVLGGSGMGPYAAACRASEAAWGNLAHAVPAGRAISIAWPLWENTGIAETADPEVMRAAGAFSLSRARGLNVFRAAVGLGRPYLITGLDSRHPEIRSAIAQNPRAIRHPVAVSRVAIESETVDDEFGLPVHCTAIQLGDAGETREALLARIESTRGSLAPGLPPRNSTERRMAALWRSVLGKPVNDVRASFFEFGGQSLLLTQLASRIQEEFAVDIPLSGLFESATIDGMSRLVLRRAAAKKDPKALGELASKIRALTPAQIGRLLAEKRSEPARRSS